MEFQLLNQFQIQTNFLETISDYLKILKKIQTNIVNDADENDRNGEISDVISRSSEVIEFYKTITLRNTKICVFVGRTSSGKSSLINAVLSNKILPSGCGTTSINIVEIKSSPEKEGSIFMIDEEFKTSQSPLSSLAQALGTKTYKYPVKVFIPTDTKDNILHSLILIDTPGVGRESSDEPISLVCKSADIIILVISSLVEIGEDELKLLSKSKVSENKTQVIMVYNFWDWPSSDAERKQLKKKFDAEAKDKFESNNLKVFYVSATKEFSSNEIKKEKTYEFEKLIEFLKMESKELPYNRRIRMFKKSLSIITQIHESLSKMIESILANIDSVKIMVSKEMENKDDMKQIVAKYLEIVNKTLDRVCEKIIKSANENKDPSNALDIKGLSSADFEEMNRNIKTLIDDTKSYSQSVKHVVIDRLQKIPSELLFVKDDYEDLNNELNNIQFKAKLKENIGSGVDGALEVASRATGGASKGVICVLNAMGDVTSKITGKDISGKAISRLAKKPFGFILDKEEASIKKHFKEIKVTIRESSENIVGQIISDMDSLVEDLKRHSEYIKTSYDELMEQSNVFIKSSVVFM